jgi:HAD superfamily hydrolase (TIGR01509 family)
LSVLLVSGGGFQGLTLQKLLRESSDVRVVVADVHADNVGRHFADAFHVLPPVADRPGFEAALVEVCRREGIGLVLPSTHHELLALAGMRERLAAVGAPAAVTAPAFLARLLDKREQMKALAEEGLPVLPVLDVGRPDLPFPILGRPADGWGSRGTRVARSASELGALSAAEREGCVWQRRLEGFDEYSVDFAIDLAGVASDYGARRRVRTSGGYAVISESASTPALPALCERLGRWLADRDGRGLFNVQVLVRDGEAHVSDVNPRVGTSAAHWRGTGFNPALHVCRSVDPGLPASRPPRADGRRSVRYLEELFLEPLPAPRARLRGVVFDLDDTLLDHKRWIVAKLALVPAALPGLLPDRRRFLTEALRLLEEGARPDLIERVVSALRLDPGVTESLIEAYRCAAPRAAPLFPDALPALEGLRAAGYRLALLADNPPESQRRKLDAAPELAAHLDAVVLAREAGAEKPDPRGFLAAAERLGLPPSACAMVGDNPHRDVLGALDAGYGAAVLVTRPSGLFRFDPSLFGELAGVGGRFLAVEGLRLLTALLGRAPAAGVTSGP